MVNAYETVNAVAIEQTHLLVTHWAHIHVVDGIVIRGFFGFRVGRFLRKWVYSERRHIEILLLAYTIKLVTQERTTHAKT